MDLQPKHILAPQILGDFWFNSEPVSIRDRQGTNVFLIDFWDYSCVSCLRTLPYIKDWQRKYLDFGLAIIGVHTPEYKFSRSHDMVQRALKNLGIEYPVVSDNEAIVWNAYGIRFWPTRVLVDVDGYVRFIQHGETGYLEFERAIQHLLVEAGYRGELPDLMKPIRDTDEPGAALYQSTRKMPLGYLKGTIGNPEGFGIESTVEYLDQGMHLPERFYANGRWMSEKDFICFKGLPGEQGTVAFQYEAREVNAIINSQAGTRFEVTVTQDEKPLTDRNAGLDVVLVNPEKSVIYVDTPGLYRLVKNPDFQSHSLKLTVKNPGIEIYAFSFVTAAIPDVVPSRTQPFGLN